MLVSTGAPEASRLGALMGAAVQVTFLEDEQGCLILSTFFAALVRCRLA